MHQCRLLCILIKQKNNFFINKKGDNKKMEKNKPYNIENKYINEIEYQVKATFEKIKSGDRTPLTSGKMYDLGFLNSLTSEQFYAIRKHLKNRIGAINKKIETAEKDELRDLMLSITLYDQMKYDVKKTERDAQLSQEK